MQLKDQRQELQVMDKHILFVLIYYIYENKNCNLIYNYFDCLGQQDK
jgi:hypothetical protein